MGPSRKGLNIGVCAASSSLGLLLYGFHHCVLYVWGGKLCGRWLKFKSETKVNVVVAVAVVVIIVRIETRIELGLKLDKYIIGDLTVLV